LLGAASLTGELLCPNTFTFKLSLALLLNMGRRHFHKLPASQIDLIFCLIISNFAVFVNINIFAYRQAYHS
jgi:hypothetical protein